MKKGIQLSLAAAGLFAASAAQAALFTEDFEGTDPLSNFTFIDSSGGVNSAEVVNDAGNNVLEVDANSNANNFPGGFAQANGVALSTAEDFSVTFDFYIDDSGTWGDAMLMFGEIGSAVNDGDYYGIVFNNDVNSCDVWRYNGASRSEALSDYASAGLGSSWKSASLDWAADTGTLSFEVTEQGGGASLGSFSTTTFSLDTVEVGFGSLNDTGQFDNITVIPEPATIGLVAAFGGGLLFVRRLMAI